MTRGDDWLAYLAFARASFMKLLAYRLRYFTGILSYLVYVSTYYFLWKAVYENRADQSALGGFNLNDLVTYVIIGWMARSFYFNNIDREIANLVAEGEIVFALSRPISFQGMMVAGALGESMFRLLFFTVPICVTLLLIYPVQPPASVAAGAAFALSCVLALLILVQINFLVGLTSLYLKSIQGVLRAKHYLLELLSGLLLPVTLFPDWLAKASSWLPFQSLAFVPSSVYLGRLSGSDLGRALGVQALWATVLAATGALWWRRISRRLTVHGG